MRSGRKRLPRWLLFALSIGFLISSCSKPVANWEALELAERIPDGASIAEVRHLFGESPDVDLYHDGDGSWSGGPDAVRERCFVTRPCSMTSGHVETSMYPYLGALFPFCENDAEVNVFFERDADPALAPYPGAPNRAVGWVVRDAHTCL